MRPCFAALALASLLLACREPAAQPPAPPPVPPVPPKAEPAPAAVPPLEACVDRWLAARGLNEFGDPAGTLYAGGTPLFDEASGVLRDRLDYVFARQPQARADCLAAASDAGQKLPDTGQ